MNPATRFVAAICVLTFALSAIASAAAPATRPSPPVTGVEHVVVLGIDGLSADGVRKGAGEHLRQLMADGAYTLRARAVLPTVSSPNWASILTSALPSQHGVTSNKWTPTEHNVPPVVRGPGGGSGGSSGGAEMFPTIFSVLRDQDPAATSAVFHQWKEFALLVEPDRVNVIEHTPTARETEERAIAHLREAKPRLTFVHYDDVDHAGHTFGWMTPEYLDAVRGADGFVGRVRAAVREAGIERSTVIILVADHGGLGKSHGGISLSELEIPWMIVGPGVAKGREIESPVNNYDTAATIAWLLGLEPPAAWVGRPVRDSL